MKLYLAEKPSLARAIAAALPTPQKKHKGYIELANGDVVSWCIGHLLEQAQPEVYNDRFKKWQMDDLPIIPEKWQLQPKKQTKSQLSVLRKLVKNASVIIHAGDPDREGQLLVDEVIDYFNVSKAKRAAVQRLLISDLNEKAVKRSLNNLQSNQAFIPLSISALARARADWLYGINLTRAFTLQGKKAGYNGVLSVGRVQTPLLGLVVAQDKKIADFIVHDYFDVHAQITASNGTSFLAKWQPSEACLPYMDDNGKVLNKALAENVAQRITDQPAHVEDVKQQQKQQLAALPYNLSALQIDAAKQFSMNAKLVLDVCQALYEKHNLITYPRSDCRYLPLEHFNDAKSIIKMLGQSKENYGKFAQQADSSIKGRAWNSKKVTAHHAIIPTEKPANSSQLNSFEKNIYQLIVRQYLAQFYPPYLYQHTQASFIIAGGVFKVTANTPEQMGWKVMYQSAKKNASSPPSTLSEQQLPPLTKGETLLCTKGIIEEKVTQPPKPFTDATLLAAMTGIAKYVTDKQIKSTLRETDGLGTEATRAGIIELLFKRGYLARQGKAITATQIGKSLISALPTMATTPDMTAFWEATLNDISEKQSSYNHFIQPLCATITTMIAGSEQQNFTGLPKTPIENKFIRKKRTRRKPR